MFCRSHFLRRTDPVWKYPTMSQMCSMLAGFSSVHYKLVGLLGAFGRSETTRMLLGAIDKALVPLTPRSWRYIMGGVAVK